MSEHTEQDLKVRVSKYMSYLLRHDPENLKIDKQGFVDLDKLLKKLNQHACMHACFRSTKISLVR